MSGLHSIFIYPHDSIGLGEDRPTHQPISQLMNLRSIPGLTVVPPADAQETLEAWRFLVSHDGPVVLALSRQVLPPIQRDGDVALDQGGYVVTVGGEDSDVVLIGTGSELSLAQSAA
jgi:transketolase